MQVSGLHSSGETGISAYASGKANTAAYSGEVAGTPMPSDADTAARDGRYELREGLRVISGLERLQKCGVSVLAGGVTPVIRNGRAGFAGVVTCGSVHVCPCCGTSIRSARQETLDQVGVAWECASCGLAMMTVTMRHYERQELQLLVDQQRDAWKNAFGQNAKRGWRDAKKTFGLRGFIRAWETTHGPNGWHVHFHVLLFFARPLTREQKTKFEAIAYTAWSDALVKVGAYKPSEKYGVRIDVPDRGESGTLARYLMKNQDGKASWGVAAELTRQDVKQGKNGHRTPFEIARAAILDNADPRDIALWCEFEQAASGIRSLYWSNGLKQLLADMGIDIDDRTDGTVAEEEAAAGTRLAMIPAQTWYQHIARRKGRALALLKAAEKGGVIAVQALIESWGLLWGADVHEAEELPPAGGFLTADEILRRGERVLLAARAEAWRRGFALAELVDQRNMLTELAGDQMLNYSPEHARIKSRAAAAKRTRLQNERDATPAPWWSAYEDPAVIAQARADATPPPRNKDQEEFLQRRRAANIARADDRLAAINRVRQTF
jgi:hypothetical protein